MTQGRFSAFTARTDGSRVEVVSTIRLTRLDNDLMNDETPKPRWWTRLLHRPGWLAVLAVCLLLSAVLVPFGWRYYRVQQLVAGIEACGGGVGFELGGPTWLRNIVGDEWMKPFDIPSELLCQLPAPISAGRAWYKVGEFDDEEFLAYVVPLNHLYGFKRVGICNSQMTNRSFKALAHFDDLEQIGLGSKAFNDDALAHLANARKLRSLDLSGTSVTDEGLQHLQGLKDLESLSLSNTDVTDEGVSELQRHLPGLDVSDD
ncbi:Leucine Rich repeats (2 copies) [Symmachiella macrocystis]|uniref:Leucine Rich repeats (2 copies) n=2 Tax=Symmachiella macrocystis TaxID=2527985 RepID=A0A5C6BUI4_9PLAN|nr:Leucine Rich repeats (2 copies) [Symmachiella macrocystis]